MLKLSKLAKIQKRRATSKIRVILFITFYLRDFNFFNLAMVHEYTIKTLIIKNLPQFITKAVCNT